MRLVYQSCSLETQCPGILLVVSHILSAEHVKKYQIVSTFPYSSWEQWKQLLYELHCSYNLDTEEGHSYQFWNPPVMIDLMSTWRVLELG